MWLLLLSHFIDEGSEAQRGEVTCLDSHKDGEQTEFKPRSAWMEPELLILNLGTGTFFFFKHLHRGNVINEIGKCGTISVLKGENWVQGHCPCPNSGPEALQYGSSKQPWFPKELTQFSGPKEQACCLCVCVTQPVDLLTGTQVGSSATHNTSQEGIPVSMGVNWLVFKLHSALYSPKCFEQVLICKNKPLMSYRTKFNEITGGKSLGYPTGSG